MGLRARIWPGLRPPGIAAEAAIALASTAVVAVGAATPGGGPLAVAVPGTAVLAVLLFLFRRTRPLLPFAMSAVLTAIAPVVSVAVLVTSYAVGRYVPRWPLRAGAAVVGAVAVAQPWTLQSPEEWAGGFGGAAAAVLLPGALGAWAQTRSQLLAALTERAERAEAERELLARDAVLTERTRIAREMHDVVGHRVSLMVLQAGAIELAATDPQRVEQLAGQVQTAGREALEELREMVGVLRGGEVDEAAPLGPQPGLADLPRLVAGARDAGMAVRLCGPPQGAGDPAVGRAAYRVVQEALTNVSKHAPGAAVTVAVQPSAEGLLVRVVNGPAATTPGTTPGGGFGLVGLAERVRTLGGRLRAEPRLDGGFAVEAVLPLGRHAPQERTGGFRG